MRNLPKEFLVADGSCIPNPNGIWAYRVVNQDRQIIYQSPIYPFGTNNIAEWSGLVAAVRLAIKLDVKTVYTDSRIAIKWLKSRHKHKKVASSHADYCQWLTDWARQQDKEVQKQIDDIDVRHWSKKDLNCESLADFQVNTLTESV